MKPPYSTSILAKTKARVYRMFDKDHVLLYVGCSLNVIARCKGHNHSGSVWFKDVRTITVGRWRMRGRALQEERRAIAFEHPLYNTQIGGCLYKGR